MRRIHILHLRKSEGYYGAERVIINLSQWLNQNGYVSWVGCIHDLRHPNQSLVEEARKLNIPSVILTCRFRLDFQTINHIIKFIKQNNIMLIHCHGFKADIYGWLVSKWVGVPVVTTMHGWTRSNRLIRFWEWLDLFFLKSFDQVVTVSEEIKKSIIQKGIKNTRIRTIKNGINIKVENLKINNKIKKNFGWNDKSLVVGIIGRLSIEKGHRYFLEAARQILDTMPSVKFLIVGTGNLYNELKTYSIALGIEKSVGFTGFRSDIDNILSCIDVVVSSSLREGIPLTILEAFANAKPVVATSVGGIIDLIIHGVNGYLVQKGDVKAIAKYVLKLLKSKNKRKIIGKKSRQYVINHNSSDQMSESYHMLYKKVLSDK